MAADVMRRDDDAFMKKILKLLAKYKWRKDAGSQGGVANWEDDVALHMKEDETLCRGRSRTEVVNS